MRRLSNIVTQRKNQKHFRNYMKHIRQHSISVRFESKGSLFCNRRTFLISKLCPWKQFQNQKKLLCQKMTPDRKIMNPMRRPASYSIRFHMKKVPKYCPKTISKTSLLSFRIGRAYKILYQEILI